MPKLPHPLGRNKSPLDVNDFNLANFIPKGAPLISPIERVWEYPSDHVPLDQGDTPHCVGFAIANFGINLPVHFDYTNESGHEFYYGCKEIDKEPKKENGSTIRTAAKLLRDSGRIEAYAFAPDMSMIKYWLLNQGPMIMGTVWTMDMFTPDQNYVVRPTGDTVGGHAWLANEWTRDNLIGFQNSWGGWGKNGKAYISAEDFEKIFKYDGEALAAVELDNYKQKKPCPLADLIRKIFS